MSEVSQVFEYSHGHKIVVALSETICVMQEIDAVIAYHGGWPDAFESHEGQAPK